MTKVYLLFKATRVARRFEEKMGNLWGTPKTPAQMLEECEIDIGVGIKQMKRAREDFDDECKSLRDYAKAALQEGNVKICATEGFVAASGDESFSCVLTFITKNLFQR
jgi:hypothetical protein